MSNPLHAAVAVLLAAACVGATAAAPPASELEQLWAELGSNDPVAVERAMSGLVAQRARAVALLQQRLRPVPAVDPRRLAEQLAALDSKKFVVREKATRELEQVAEVIEADLEKALGQRPSAEVRRRVGWLLEKVRRDRLYPPAERLRAARAVEVLERIGDAGARQLLGSLAGGASSAQLTVDAKAALERLTQQEKQQMPCDNTPSRSRPLSACEPASQDVLHRLGTSCLLALPAQEDQRSCSRPSVARPCGPGSLGPAGEGQNWVASFGLCGGVFLTPWAGSDSWVALRGYMHPLPQEGPTASAVKAARRKGRRASVRLSRLLLALLSCFSAGRALSNRPYDPLPRDAAMATAQLGAVIRHIRNLAAGPVTSEPTDGALLRDFLACNDQVAFEALRRHGPPVLRVCYA